MMTGYQLEDDEAALLSHNVATFEQILARAQPEVDAQHQDHTQTGHDDVSKLFGGFTSFSNHMQTFDEPRVRKRPDVASLTQENNERKKATHFRDAHDEYLQRHRRKRLRRDVRSSDVSDVKSSDVSDVTPYRHRFLQQRFRPV